MDKSMKKISCSKDIQLGVVSHLAIFYIPRSNQMSYKDLTIEYW